MTNPSEQVPAVPAPACRFGVTVPAVTAACAPAAQDSEMFDADEPPVVPYLSLIHI